MTNKTEPAFDQLKTAERALEKAVNNEIIEGQEEYKKSGYSKNRDLAIGLFHRVQVHNGYAKIGAAATLSELINVKENKLYRHMAGLIYIEEGEEVAMLPTWEGFCNSLGLARRTVDEQILNLKTVGEEAYFAMTKAGIGIRDFRKLRQITDEDRSILVNEVEANLDDKESILNLIDDLSAKHVKEKEALNNEISDLKQKDETNERLFADKDKKINELDRKLDQANNTLKKWSERTYEISLDTTQAASNALQAVNQLDTLRDAIQNETFGEHDQEDAIEAMAIVYYDAVRMVFEKTSWLMSSCNEVFEGYKLGAVPLIDLDHLYGDLKKDEQS